MVMKAHRVMMMSTWFGFTWAKGKNLLLSARSSLRQLDHQRRLLPQYKHKLVVPLLARFAKLHVEMPEHPRKDAANLRVGQPGTIGISGDTLRGDLEMQLTSFRCSSGDRRRRAERPLSGRLHRLGRQASAQV